MSSRASTFGFLLAGLLALALPPAPSATDETSASPQVAQSDADDAEGGENRPGGGGGRPPEERRQEQCRFVSESVSPTVCRTTCRTTLICDGKPIGPPKCVAPPC